jgi:uncharacterized membrane protein
MTALTDRLDRFENRLRSMESELGELRRLAHGLDPHPEPEPEPEWVFTAPVFGAEAVSDTISAPEPPEPFDWSALLGARALAWTGGAVMLLGIVFFFVLAVERGWIGPWTRVGLGGAASIVCIGAGLWVRRQFGDTYASVSAAGVGVAGLYTTLLAATALYDLVPRPTALVAAAAIAAVGALLAIRWHSETLASLGLLGAMVVPVPIAIQGGNLSSLGVGFAAFVFAAAIPVTVPRDWRVLYAASTVVTTLQAIALVATHAPHATLVAAAVWLLSATGAVWLALRTRLTYLPASLLLLSGAFGGYSGGLLYDETGQGLVLLAVALGYAVPSAALFRRDRDVASVLWAIALAIGAVSAASLLSGATLTMVWVAEAAILAWLARRILEPRFQLASLAWLVLAYVHALAFDAPPSKLFLENDDAWRAVPSASAFAIGTALVALSTFEREPRAEGIFARVFADLHAAQARIRRGGIWVAGAAALYAGSLAVVTLPASWDWGHTAVAALWAAVAVALARTPFRRHAAVVALAATALVAAYDSLFVDATPRAWAFASVALALLVVALAAERRLSIVTLVLSAALASATTYLLLDGDTRGVGFLVVAAAYAAVGVAVHGRNRDLASALGIVALALAVPGSRILLDATWLVLVWAAASAALALLARYEDRLFYGALAYLGLAFLRMLLLAKPEDAFVAQAHPGAGVPAVLLVAGAAGVLAWRNEEVRTRLLWLGGALGVYAATLAILEASEDLGGGVDAAFQRGHTGVSCLWGGVGLALLVAGLKRRGRGLRLGGLALFGISLAKLFVYDLAFLSSVARALSFLAVGAVMIVGGFFYQRLNVDSRA